LSLHLFILRHGKSEPLATTDFERALAPRGISEAQELARRMPQPGPSDLALVSDAVRTRQTAENLLKGWGLDGWPAVSWEEHGYLAPARFWLECVAELPTGTGNVYIVGHNPGVSDLIDLLVRDSAAPAFLRTSEGVHLVMDLPDWKYLATGTAALREAYLR
jgi:phosphohistidine phosphatase